MLDDKWSLAGLICSFILFIFVLISGRLEGLVCILLALPLILLAAALGAFAKHRVKKHRNKKEKENNFKVVLLPLILFCLSGFIEKWLINNEKQVVSITSEIVLPYSPMQVYDAIKSVDTLDAEKPFLMKLDLPVPQKCLLEAEQIGALRTCYFEGGQIVERITKLQKGKLLKMDVIDYQLTGRQWLGFKEAIYIFEEVAPNQCKMTRITTYTSELKPRFYWQPLEKIGIEQAHQYVFNNLKKDLKVKSK